MSLSKVIDWFIPPAFRKDAESYRRARVLVSASLFIGTLALVVRMVRASSQQGDPIFLIALLGIAVVLSAPFLLRWTGRLRLAGAIPVLVPIVFGPMAALQTGGLAAPVLMGCAMVPVLATFLLGARMGIACAVILILELATFAALHARGYHFNQRIPADKMYLFEVSIATVAIVITTFLTWLYERERHAVEDKLRQEIAERRRAERAKDDFVATVSHELRTPLTAIRGAVELLENGVYGPFEQPVGELLTLTARNARNLSLLVDDLLDIRAIEEGKLSMQHRLLPLASVVRDAVATNRTLATSHDTEFCLTVEDESLEVRGDRQRLQQIMSNLLSNAAKYTRPGTKVEIAVERRDARARVSVTDRGLGIPESFRGKVFARFAQADTSSTRARGGTGLGLHITRALVEAHSGTIGFDTEEGTGTTFYVELPIHER